jgi:hypothetical protein
MTKQIKFEEALKLTEAKGSTCIETEVLLGGYYDTWVVKYLGEDYKFKLYSDKYNFVKALEPQKLVTLSRVELVHKTTFSIEWVDVK